MKRTSITALVMSLIVIVMTSLFALSSCTSRKYVPDVQGSKVMMLDSTENIASQKTTTYDKFSSFNGSEYAGMHLDDFGFSANNSFYTRKFFKTRKLIVTKFSSMSNIEHFIASIDVKGNDYNVSILEFNKPTIAAPVVTPYALFLEVPTKESVKDAKVNINFKKVTNKLDDLSGTSNNSSNKPVYTDLITNNAKLQEYANRDDDTAMALGKYDETTFLSHYLLAVDFEMYNDNNVVYEYSADENKLNLMVFNSDHYKNSTQTLKRQVKFVPLARNQIVDTISITTMWEDDFGQADRTKTINVNISSSYSLK